MSERFLWCLFLLLLTAGALALGAHHRRRLARMTEDERKEMEDYIEYERRIW